MPQGVGRGAAMLQLLKGGGTAGMSGEQAQEHTCAVLWGRATPSPCRTA